MVLNAFLKPQRGLSKVFSSLAHTWKKKGREGGHIQQQGEEGLQDSPPRPRSAVGMGMEDAAEPLLTAQNSAPPAPLLQALYTTSPESSAKAKIQNKVCR